MGGCSIVNGISVKPGTDKRVKSSDGIEECFITEGGLKGERTTPEYVLTTGDYAGERLRVCRGDVIQVPGLTMTPEDLRKMRSHLGLNRDELYLRAKPTEAGEICILGGHMQAAKTRWMVDQLGTGFFGWGGTCPDGVDLVKCILIANALELSLGPDHDSLWQDVRLIVAFGVGVPIGTLVLDRVLFREQIGAAKDNLWVTEDAVLEARQAANRAGRAAGEGRLAEVREAVMDAERAVERAQRAAARIKRINGRFSKWRIGKYIRKTDAALEEAKRELKRAEEEYKKAKDKFDDDDPPRMSGGGGVDPALLQAAAQLLGAMGAIGAPVVLPEAAGEKAPESAPEAPDSKPGTVVDPISVDEGAGDYLGDGFEDEETNPGYNNSARAYSGVTPWFLPMPGVPSFAIPGFALGMARVPMFSGLRAAVCPAR